MKAFLLACVSALTLATSLPALSDTTAPTDEQMIACYRAHHQLMDKPSHQNLVDCWRAHHGQMPGN